MSTENFVLDKIIEENFRLVKIRREPKPVDPIVRLKSALGNPEAFGLTEEELAKPLYQIEFENPMARSRIGTALVFRSGIETVRGVLGLTYNDLMGIDNLGKGSINELLKALVNAGYQPKQ